MSKFVFIKYRDAHNSHEVLNKLNEICDQISPSGLKMKHLIYENELCPNSYIGIQNAIDDQVCFSHLLIGQINGDMDDFNQVNRPLPDGSYSLIRFNNEQIEFFCDKFCSRTLWYLFDEEKIIISNSQRAIIALKGEFKLNIKTVTWFLSSGSQGPFLSWDQDVFMVTPNTLMSLNIKDWHLEKVDSQYIYEHRNDYKKEQGFDDYFKTNVHNSLKKIVENHQLDQLVLPLSGGYDSRLLFYLLQKDVNHSKIATINWGKDNKGSFDDKKAARAITQYYGSKHIDSILPDAVDDYLGFLQNYIKAGDCRIDHFNAYTDNFELWKNLYKSGVKILVRGDIPFTVGIDLNNKMARSHIGINQFKDYSNFKDYDLVDLLSQQENINSIARRERESLIQWRDRLYIEFRIPIVISAFSDIINSYIENRSPIMSGDLFLHYSNLKDHDKGDKKHIVRVCKELDSSKVGFDALPSIPNQVEVFDNDKGVKFLKSYLKNSCDDDIIKKELIDDVLEKLEIVGNDHRIKKKFMDVLKTFLSANLPSYMKGYLKSKRKLHLDPVTLAYRIVMVDIAVKMYQRDSIILR